MGATQTSTAETGAGYRRRPAVGRARLLRSAALGGSSMLLAGLAHMLGGGHLPTPAILTGTAVLLGLVATTATARRCGFPLLLTLVGVEQVLLHLWLTAAQAGCVLAPAGPSGGHDGHVMAGDGCLPASGAAADGIGHGWGMWLAHAVTVVLTARLLARGEAWWWRTVDRIVRAAAAPRTRRARAARPALMGGRAVRLAQPHPSPAASRGPPVLIAG